MNLEKPKPQDKEIIINGPFAEGVNAVLQRIREEKGEISWVNEMKRMVTEADKLLNKSPDIAMRNLGGLVLMKLKSQLEETMENPVTRDVFGEELFSKIFSYDFMLEDE